MYKPKQIDIPISKISPEKVIDFPGNISKEKLVITHGDSIYQHMKFCYLNKIHFIEKWKNAHISYNASMWLYLTTQHSGRGSLNSVSSTSNCKITTANKLVTTYEVHDTTRYAIQSMKSCIKTMLEKMLLRSRGQDTI